MDDESDIRDRGGDPVGGSDEVQSDPPGVDLEGDPGGVEGLEGQVRPPGNPRLAEVSKGTQFPPGHGGNNHVLSAILPQPSKTQMQMDLEWAYKNMGTRQGAKATGQRKAFIDDFLADRDKTLKLLAQLEREYRSRKKEWQDSKLARKREEEQLALEMARAKSVAEVGVTLEDMGEEAVEELVRRLISEAKSHVGSTGAQAL